MNSYEIAFIVIGVLIVVISGGARGSVAVMDGLLSLPQGPTGLVMLLQIVLLSMAFAKGGDDEFWFVAYASWAWSWLLVMGILGSNVKVNSLQRGIQGLMGLWTLAILGTAIASAASYGTNNPLDDRGLCIFAFVTTFLPALSMLTSIRY